MISIDHIKSAISHGGGIAKSNLYKVIFPVIPNIGLNENQRYMDVLCRAATLPGKQILTTERTIGVVNQKVAYGFANDEVSFTFMGLNNYGVRRYFEAWQNHIMNPETHEVRYKEEYARPVVIQHMNQLGHPIYGVRLEKAFPIQLLNIDLTNENAEAVDINVTMTYTKWKQIEVRPTYNIYDLLEHLKV